MKVNYQSSFAHFPYISCQSSVAAQPMAQPRMIYDIMFTLSVDRNVQENIQFKKFMLALDQFFQGFFYRWCDI